MKRLFLIIALLTASSASAQVALMPFTKAQFFDNSGHPCSGCLLFTYTAGTTTPLVTYRDAAGTVPNSNPVVLDSAGRADVWLTGVSYRFIMRTALSVQLWTEDGITSSSLALLSSNNVWTGTNNFNGAVGINGGLTVSGGISSFGPNLLNGGGQMSGNWSGSPVFTGTPNFSGGFQATIGTFSGQIISTVAVSPPMVVASSNKVINFNADLLDGADWNSPNAIGNITPANGTFNILIANTSFKLNGSTVMTAIDGTDTHLATSSATSPATLAPACYDSLGGLTDDGCIATRVTQTATQLTVCTTGSSSFDTCDTVVSWPVAFATSAYTAVCMGVGPTDPRAALQGSTTQGTTSITVRVVTNGTNPASYASIKCIGVL